MSFEFYLPTRILFGAGELNNLHKQNLGGKKALLVISNGKSAKANGYLDRVEEQLKKAGLEFVLFNEVEPNPLKSTVMRGAEAARKNNCDVIVALGGGSVMDASKAIAAMATNDGDLWDYIQFGKGKKKSLQNKPLPLVTVTTTAGTGSEADNGAVITNPETNEKTAFFSEYSFPIVSIIDPELMTTVPPHMTAYQGFDALFHSVEGYISNKANLMTDMLALSVIENVGRNLAETVRNGKNVEAREKVAYGNTMSGFVMTVGTCTSEHSLEHALSAYHQELPHGAGLIMISKAYYTHFINQHVCDDRFVKMAKALGMEDAKEPMDFVKALVKLQADCGVADLKMSEYGIKPEEFPAMAENALDCMGFLFACDRIKLSKEDCVAIYQASYK